VLGIFVSWIRHILRCLCFSVSHVGSAIPYHSDDIPVALLFALLVICETRVFYFHTELYLECLGVVPHGLIWHSAELAWVVHVCVDLCSGSCRFYSDPIRLFVRARCCPLKQTGGHVASL